MLALFPLPSERAYLPCRDQTTTEWQIRQTAAIDLNRPIAAVVFVPENGQAAGKKKTICNPVVQFFSKNGTQIERK